MTLPALTPRMPDGRPLSMPLAFERGVFLYVCGAADHATNGRGEGSRFHITRDTAGVSTLEWSFNDWVKAVGGSGRCVGGAVGDEVSYTIYAPATQVEVVTPGTGSVVLADTGLGFNVIVPFDGGTHNIVPGGEVPVPPSAGEDSYWSWSHPDFGKGVVSPQTGGGYNLYDADIPLSRHAANIQLLADRDFTVGVENVEPLIMLPHWKWRCTLTTTGERSVAVVWELRLVRKRTTKEW